MMRPNRRQFLGLSAGFALFPLAAEGAAAQKRLVVVMLRGAVDGLSVLVPYREEAYYQGRPNIAIARPGTQDGALALDADFALHPALAGLMPLWQQRQLAFIQAAGSPDPTRSHFDAQLFIENARRAAAPPATAGMNRLLAALPGPRAPTEATRSGRPCPRSWRARCRRQTCRSAATPDSRCRSIGRRRRAPSTGSMPATTRSAATIARGGPTAAS